MSNKCCVKDSKDACDHTDIPASCNMEKCNDDLKHNGKFVVPEKLIYQW